MGIWDSIRAAASGNTGLPVDVSQERVDQFGTLPEQPDPADVAPRVGGSPIGASGRAHFSGFIQTDEHLPELVGVRGILKFDQMYYSDAYVRRLVLMIWSLIQSGTWDIDPFGGDEATELDRDVAAKVWWWITTYMRPNLWMHLAEVGPVLLRSGFAPFEQIWKRCAENPQFGSLPANESLALPYKLDLRLPRTILQFPQDEMNDLAAITQILPNAKNVLIPASELVYYRVQPEGDNWQGRSLLRQAYRSWYMKWHLEEVEAIGLERKAVGMPLVFPPMNATTTQKEQVEACLANLHTGEAAYMMMPGPSAEFDKDNGWHIIVVKFDSSSGGEINDAINRHQDGIAASFLGDFMSLGHHQVGARATAEVQEDPFLTAGGTLIELVLAPLNALVERVVRLNWPKAQGAPKLKLALTDTASLSEIATFLQLLVTVGVIEPDPELEDWARSRAQMPVANSVLRQFGFQAQVARLQAQITGSKQVAAGKDPNQQQEGQVEGTQEGSDGSPGNDQPDNFAQQKKLDDGQVDAKWFERLLAQRKLAEALAGAKDTVNASAKPAALKVAALMATTASLAEKPTGQPSLTELTSALEAAYANLYQLGHESAAYELERQHQHLGTGGHVQLMNASDLAGAVGARLGRARQRAEISARQIAQAVGGALDRARTGGASSLAALQAQAQRAATGQLVVEANANAMDLINAGRFDLADTNANTITQAIYTSCMDGSTCDECGSQDGTVFTDVGDAEQAVPNALCAGGPARCRCTVVFTLTDDPRSVEDIELDEGSGDARLRMLLERVNELAAREQVVPIVQVTPEITLRPEFTIEQPAITVNEGDVTLEQPEATPEKPRRRRVTFDRDAKGQLTGGIVEEEDAD